MASRGRGAALLEENASEQASRLGQVSFEIHGPLCVALRVGQAIVPLIQPRQIHMRDGIPLRSPQRGFEGPPGTVLIPERQATDPDIHEEPWQRVVQSRRGLERRQRLIVPILLLQCESAELVPQRETFARVCEPLRDPVSAPVTAPRVCAAQREPHGGLVGLRLRAGLQMRNRFGVSACFHEHQSEELPDLQE